MCPFVQVRMLQPYSALLEKIERRYFDLQQCLIYNRGSINAYLTIDLRLRHFDNRTLKSNKTVDLAEAHLM